MKLLIFYFANRQYGYGHHYRCQALADYAKEQGHTVRIMSDLPVTDYLLTIYSVRHLLSLVLGTYYPDWIVLDIPDVIAEITEVARAYHVPVATLNSYPNTDLEWIQNSPERIILRRSILNSHWLPGKEWFVFGGSADLLGLLSCFMVSVSEPAILLETNLSAHIPPDILGYGQRAVRTRSEREYLLYFTGCKAACLHLGMTAWEAAYLGIPQYLFSRDIDYLEMAQRLEELGLALAWPVVGLPESSAAFRDFLHRSFIPTGQKPDGRGIQRLLETLDENS